MYSFFLTSSPPPKQAYFEKCLNDISAKTVWLLYFENAYLGSLMSIWYPCEYNKNNGHSSIYMSSFLTSPYHSTQSLLNLQPSQYHYFNTFCNQQTKTFLGIILSQ